MTDPNPLIISETDAGVCTITLNRPEAKNSLSPDLVDQLGRSLQEAMEDDGVRLIVLTNTGNTFCAGADLKSTRPGVARAEGSSPLMTFIDVFNLMLDGPKPVIGRIDGHATGGGVGLVAACDLSIMRSDALLGFTEVRIGVAPAVISVVCLPKMSPADASELFLTGERISPDRAVDAGLINRSVPPEDLDSVVAEFVAKIGLGGPNAITASKRLLRTVPTLDREAAFGFTEPLSRDLFVTDEAREGIAAFRERRNPAWVDGPGTDG